MAVAEQTLLGLRENIFSQLESADYLVFVDFKREELKSNDGTTSCRGSLFSHQELGIASFLKIPALIFQEAGVKERDGMLGAMQANAIPFSDRNLLTNVVADFIYQKACDKSWTTQTRHQLTLEVASPIWVDASPAPGRLRRFYHIAVNNLHHRKAAMNCSVYLDAILDLNSNKLTHPNTIEFKWAGTGLPGVRIGPSSSRKFDACWFEHILVGMKIVPQLGFNVLTDSTDYIPKIKTPGKYQLTFSVVSQDFPPQSANFMLEVGNTLESISISSAL